MFRYAQECFVPDRQYRFAPPVLPQTLQDYLTEAETNHCYKGMLRYGRGRSMDRSQQGRDVSRSRSFSRQRPSPTGEGLGSRSNLAIHQLQHHIRTASDASAELFEELQVHQLSQQRPCLACGKIGEHEPYKCPTLRNGKRIMEPADQKTVFLGLAQLERTKAKSPPAQVHQLHLETQPSDSTTDTIVDTPQDFHLGGQK